MKLIQKLSPLITLPLLLSAPLAHASYSFNGSSQITVSIDNITNLTHSGDLSSLTLKGSFSEDTQQQYQYKTGDGNASFLGSDIATTDLSFIGSQLSQSRTLAGSVSTDDSYIDSNYFETGEFTFKNSSTTDSYRVDFSLNYDLSAQTVSNTSSLDINLDYYNSDYSIDGTDEALANDSSPSAGTGPINKSFTLVFDPNNKGTFFYTEASYTGYSETPVSSVPLPGAVWLLLSGIISLHSFRIRKAS